MSRGCRVLGCRHLLVLLKPQSGSTVLPTDTEPAPSPGALCSCHPGDPCPWVWAVHPLPNLPPSDLQGRPASGSPSSFIPCGIPDRPQVEATANHPITLSVGAGKSVLPTTLLLHLWASEIVFIHT